MKKIKLPILGMTCAHCSKTVEDVLQSQGITSKVNLAQANVTFSYDEEKVSLLYIQRLIKKAGFTLVLPNQKKKFPWELIRLIVAIFVLTVSILGMFCHLGLHNAFFEFFSNRIFMLVIASISLLILGIPFNIRAIKALKNKRMGMDMLISLSTIIAFALSLYTFIAQKEECYFESTSMILAIISIGDRITAKLKKSTGESKEDSLKNDGKKVLKIKKDGTYKEIDIDEVEVDDLILIPKGELVSADGIIVRGFSTIEESILTGESKPRDVKENDSVYYGTTNLQNEIVIKVTKPAIDSLYMGVILESYALDNSKGHLTKLSDFFASIFVPVVFVISIIGFIVAFFGMKFSVEKSLISAVSILVVSCPCAFGLAVPLSSLNGYNKALKEGIMFKDGSTFEKIKKVTEFYFDKTGTLTNGKMQVTCMAYNDKKYLALAKGMELHSIHPIAKGIVEHLNNVHEEIIDEVEEVAGKGLKYGLYKLGNYDFVGNPILEGNFKIVDDYEGTKVFLTYDEMLLAAFVLEDELSCGAKELISALHQKGIKTYMLTGDNEKAALKIGERLGFKKDEIFYNLLPKDKIDVITKNKKPNSISAYCGDGVNDLLALKLVDLSVASYDASQAARSSADVILLKNDMRLIAKTISLSKHVYINILENFIWAFIYNAFMIPLAMIGKLNPSLSASLMIASNITLILNSWRIKLWKGETKHEINS